MVINLKTFHKVCLAPDRLRDGARSHLTQTSSSDQNTAHWVFLRKDPETELASPEHVCNFVFRSKSI